jgi:hypothetical protein
MKVHIDCAVYMLLILHFEFAKQNAIYCNGKGKGHPITGREGPEGE